MWIDCMDAVDIKANTILAWKMKKIQTLVVERSVQEASLTRERVNEIKID